MKRILEIQKEIGTLSKKSENPFFKSAYLDLNDLLNAVHPLLHDKGLILVQPIQDGLVFSAIVDAESSEVLIESSIELPDIKDPQKLGSAITYFRRYTLKSLLAIAEKDDDGNDAAKPEEPKKKPTLTLDSDEYKGGLSKGTDLEVMSLHFHIPTKVGVQYVVDQMKSNK